MRPGEVVLLRLPQPDLAPGTLRPVLMLAELPGSFGDVLVSGISSQVRQAIPDWDETIAPGDDDFVASGLKVASVVRLNWLASASTSAKIGSLGSVARGQIANEYIRDTVDAEVSQGRRRVSRL